MRGRNRFAGRNTRDRTVRSVRKVGWGIRHETAALNIDFNQLHPDDGPPIEFLASLTEVENAREQVSSKE